MKGYSELEIVLQSDGGDRYQASARHRLNEGDVITPAVAINISEDLQEKCAEGALAIGRALSDILFGPAELKTILVEARSYASSRGLVLRLRLRASTGAELLNSLPWETLVDPTDTTRHLFRDGRCVFSRYLFTKEFHLPRLRPQTKIRAFVAVANPSSLNDSFPEIDVDRCRKLAETALAGSPVHTLDNGKRATRDNILERLEAGYDIFYLVCHGILLDREPLLWLEDDDGKGARVSGAELAAKICALPHPPSLVVLCSCQSAGVGSMRRDPALAIGPILAADGVPAVLAMQGNLTFATADVFLPAFFRQLGDHGEVDRAAAHARSLVSDHDDWYVPVVFTRLDSARIWYPPGFGELEDGGSPWPSMIDKLKNRACTPILGPAMSEAVYGSLAELAAQWADVYRYPLNDRECVDLPRVSQFLASTREGVMPRRLFYKYVYARLMEKYPEHIPDHLQGLTQDDDIIGSLDAVISVVGVAVRKSADNDPYAVLASYKLPVYVTTDPSSLLVDALTEQGAHPRVRVLRWNEAAKACDENYLSNVGVDVPNRATSEHPVVLKLFGDLSAPKSLVMTEDQFFDYMSNSASKEVVPPMISARLVDTALMFLGFQADSWEFRVLFRSLLLLEGMAMSIDHRHFSVQVDPNGTLDRGSARRYIERYLQSKSRATLSQYWGDVGIFIDQLIDETRKLSTGGNP